MELTMLGTSAGQQYPGFWCNCENCRKAKLLGGRNIRKNTAAWLSPNVLIDLPAEAFMQAERFGIDISCAEYLLVTHSHEDHLFPYLLHWRLWASEKRSLTGEERRKAFSPRFTELKTLKIYGNEAVCSKIEKQLGKDLKDRDIELTCVEAFKEYDLGALKIIPLRANHQDDMQVKGLNYILQQEGKTLLYALDTGWFLPETWAVIEKYRYDAVVLEGTFGYGADNPVHMNFEKVERAYKLFIEKDLLVNPKGFYITHLCPHWVPVHDEIAPVFEKKGMTVTYDGMVLQV